MSVRALATAGFVLLVVTAGCSGFPGVDGGPTRTPYDVPTATSTPSPTATTAGSTVEATIRTSSPVIASLRGQESRVGAVRNFTLFFRTNVTRGSRSTRFTRSFRIGLDRERYSMRAVLNVSGDTSRVDEYATDRVHYVRRTAPTGDAEYRNLSGTGVPRRSPRDRAMGLLGRDAIDSVSRYDFRRDGSATFDGEAMARYVARGPEAIDGATIPAYVTDFEATLLVDRRDVLRSLSITLRGRLSTGERYVSRIRMELTGLGTTTVEPPEWIDPVPDGTTNETVDESVTGTAEGTGIETANGTTDETLEPSTRPRRADRPGGEYHGHYYYPVGRGTSMVNSGDRVLRR